MEGNTVSRLRWHPGEWWRGLEPVPARRPDRRRGPTQVEEPPSATATTAAKTNRSAPSVPRLRTAVGAWRDRARRYRKANPDKVRAYKNQWAKTEKGQAMKARERERNREKYRTRNRRYGHQNRERYLRWIAENRERNRETARAWRLAHPERQTRIRPSLSLRERRGPLYRPGAESDDPRRRDRGVRGDHLPRPLRLLRCVPRPARSTTSKHCRPGAKPRSTTPARLPRLQRPQA